MMRLFGGFGADCFAAYARSSVRDDWLDRVELHQIAPLVVHAIKFGGGYVAAAGAIDRLYADRGQRPIAQGGGIGESENPIATRTGKPRPRPRTPRRQRRLSAHDRR